MKSSLLSKLLILMISFMVCFGVLEIAARLFMDPPQKVQIQELNQDIDLSNKEIITQLAPDQSLYVYTPTGTRLKSNVKATIQNHYLNANNIQIETNDQGFRHGHIGPKKENEQRILMLGDSVTLADYVQYNETMTYYMETLLSKNIDDTSFQVINAGVGSIGIENEFAILMERGLLIEPDIVVIGLYYNDAFESISLQITKLPSILDWSYFMHFISGKIDRIRMQTLTSTTNVDVEKQIFIQNNKIADVNWTHDRAGLNLGIAYRFDDWGYAWSNAYWEQIAQTMQLIKEVTDDNGIKLVVTLLPVRYQVQSSYIDDRPQQMFVKTMDQLGIMYVDPLMALREDYNINGQNRYYDWAHMTPEGNKVVGETVASYLIEKSVI